MIWLIPFIAFILTFFVKSDFRTDDLNVYIPYIKELINGYRLGTQYDYQAYYWALSLLNSAYVKISNLPLIPTLLPLGFITLLTSTVLFTWLAYTYQNIWNYFVKSIRKIDKILLVSILVYSTLLFWNIAYPSYGNTFRRVTVIWILFTFIKYIEKRDIKYIINLIFLFILLVNFSSTGIFLSFFLLYAFLHVLTYAHDNNILKNIWFMSPAFSIWSILFRPNFWPIVLIYHVLMLILEITKSFNIADRIWSKVQPYVLFLVPISFCVLSGFFPNIFNTYKPWINFFTNPEYEMLVHYLRFDFSSSQFALLSLVNIGFWIVLITAIILTFRQKTQNYQWPITYLLFVLLVTFFNPFVARFVISNFTNLAYFRIYDILFNPITIFVCYSVVIDHLPKGWSQTVSRTIMLIVLTLGVISSNVWTYLDFSGQIDPIYHVNKQEVEVLNQLKNYIEKEQMYRQIRIVTQIYGTHLLTDLDVSILNRTRIDNQADLFSKNDSRSILNQIFLIKDGYIKAEFEQPFSETCKITKHFNTDFVILNAQYNWDVENGLGYCAEKVVEVGNYRVFRMRFEWLD